MTKIRTKLHNHIRKLVQIWTCSEVLDCFVLEHTDFLGRKAMHFDDLEGLPIQFEGECELLKLAQSLVEPNKAHHVFLALVALVRVQKFQVVVHLVHV